MTQNFFNQIKFPIQIFLTQKNFRPKFFFTQIFFDNFFLPKQISDPNFFYPKKFRPKFFLTQENFRPKFFLTQKNVTKFSDSILFTQIFFTKKILGPKIFLKNILKKFKKISNFSHFFPTFCSSLFQFSFNFYSNLFQHFLQIY